MSQVRQCPKCKTSESNNRSLQMMINECGHPICKNCVENIFARNSAPCPDCGKVLRKNHFWEQKYDNPKIERELYHRKRLSKIYCLKEDEFPTARAYNDYLENVERLVCNLVDNVKVEETEAEIAQYKEDFSDAIDRNKKKPTADDLWIRTTLEEEEARHQRVNAELQSENNQKAKNNADELNKQVLDELKSGGLPAEVIVDKRRKQQIEQEILNREEERRKKTIKIANRHDKVTFGSVAAAGAPYNHILPKLFISGPSLPSFEAMRTLGYVNNVPQQNVSRLAGGFTSELAVTRYLLESRQDLLVGI